MTTRQYLQGINAYPVPDAALGRIIIRRGLDIEAAVDDARFEGLRLAEADVLSWLADAPNVAQGGQNYTFTDEQRDALRARARAIYGEFGDEEGTAGAVTYGYKGSRL